MTTAVQWLRKKLEEIPSYSGFYTNNYDWVDSIMNEAKAREKDMMLAIIESYHNNMFYLPLKDGEAERILELMTTGQIKPKL